MNFDIYFLKIKQKTIRIIIMIFGHLKIYLDYILILFFFSFFDGKFCLLLI